MNFKAVLALPKTACSAQTHKSISFISLFILSREPLSNLKSNFQRRGHILTNFAILEEYTMPEATRIYEDWLFWEPFKYYVSMFFTFFRPTHLISRRQYFFITIFNMTSAFPQSPPTHLFVDVRNT